MISNPAGRLAGLGFQIRRDAWRTCVLEKLKEGVS